MLDKLLAGAEKRAEKESWEKTDEITYRVIVEKHVRESLVPYRFSKTFADTTKPHGITEERAKKLGTYVYRIRTIVERIK